MKRPRKPDEPFRITLDFLIAWAILAIPSLWIARPWQWDMPFYSKIAAIVLIPFAVTIIVYCPILFIQSILVSGSLGVRIAKAFISVIFGTIVIFTLAFIFGDFQPIDSWLIFIVSIWATIVMGKKIDDIRSTDEE